MEKNSKTSKKPKKCKQDITGSGSSGVLYGLGFLGSAIYYVSSANEFFWQGFLGILKSLAWPAFLVYELLKFIGA